MNPATLIATVEAKGKGQFATFKTHKRLKLKDGRIVVKESTMQMRVGHDYYNQASTKEAHESGEREKQGLPNWAESVSPFRVRHKGNGREYFRGQPTGNKAQTVYRLGNKVVSYEEIESALYAKDKKKEKSDWIYLAVDNVQEVA